MRGLGRNQRRLLVAIIVIFFVIYYKLSTREIPESLVAVVSLVDQKDAPDALVADDSPDAAEAPEVPPKPIVTPNIPKLVDDGYTRTLVIARKASEDVDWIERELGSSSFFQTAIYTVDDPVPPFIVPKNKGHEVMVYLTYIINHYDKLSDVTIFMHAAAVAWHNNDLLEDSSPVMLRALSSHKVVRDGYFNLRCHQSPGCSDQVHHLGEEFAVQNPKLAAFAMAWRELFPAQPVPKVLRHPCCSQFAVSRERIREMPLKKYEFFRNWLFRTKLDDALSGRIWEYLWQYVWTGEAELCPEVHVCYCEGFGLCFGGEKQYNAYISLEREKGNLEQVIEEDRKVGNTEGQKLVHAQERIDELKAQMKKLKEDAFQRGSTPKKRAMEV